jgi:hydrogenase expression/formation protein HypC
MQAEAMTRAENDGNSHYRHLDYPTFVPALCSVVYRRLAGRPVTDDQLREASREERRGPMCLAIPGQVIEVVDEINQIAKVDVVGVRRNVNVSLLANDGDHARPGDWVLIHVGFALSKVDEEEAHATLSLLQRMGADYEQEIEELKASVIE